jgi:hypothetical protein
MTVLDIYHAHRDYVRSRTVRYGNFYNILHAVQYRLSRLFCLFRRLIQLQLPLDVENAFSHIGLYTTTRRRDRQIALNKKIDN